MGELAEPLPSADPPEQVEVVQLLRREEGCDRLDAGAGGTELLCGSLDRLPDLDLHRQTAPGVGRSPTRRPATSPSIADQSMSAGGRLM